MEYAVSKPLVGLVWQSPSEFIPHHMRQTPEDTVRLLESLQDVCLFLTAHHHLRLLRKSNTLHHALTSQAVMKEAAL